MPAPDALSPEYNTRRYSPTAHAYCFERMVCAISITVAVTARRFSARIHHRLARCLTRMARLSISNRPIGAWRSKKKHSKKEGVASHPLKLSAGYCALCLMLLILYQSRNPDYQLHFVTAIAVSEVEPLSRLARFTIGLAEQVACASKLSVAVPPTLVWTCRSVPVAGGVPVPLK